MLSTIFFPHFYLANDTFFRHQFLYADSLQRILPTARPPRDHKTCKRFVSELTDIGFVDTVHRDEFNETVSDRFIHLVERAFESGLPDYIRYLGKYEKERASAKTFPLCRCRNWPDIVNLLTRLNLAQPDGQKEWLNSTRTLVMVLTTIHAIVLQQKTHTPRCSDAPAFDEIASLAERMPKDDGNDALISRLCLEFPYRVPANLSSLSLERLQAIREGLLPLTDVYRQTLLDTSRTFDQASTKAERTEKLRDFQNTIHESMTKVEDRLEAFGETPVPVYGQFRWYPPLDSPLEGLEPNAPCTVKDVSLSIEKLPANPATVKSLPSHPGCQIWTLESPSIKPNSGLKRLFKKWLSR